MKEFLSVLRRFVWPYKRFVALSVVFNVLSALLNIFSFAALIPILQILFKTGDHVEVKELMAWSSGSFKDALRSAETEIAASAEFSSYPLTDMLADNVADYRLYTTANGMTCTPTSNSYSAEDEEGNLYICGRTGVSTVNLNHFFDGGTNIKTDIRQNSASYKPLFTEEGKTC